MSAPVPIVVLAGPTASGKTALAVELALELGAEIVGADSVQLVRGFEIGSARPTADEQRGVPHHLLGVVEPDEPIDAMQYAAMADAVIEEVARRGRPSLVVGGTGLYLRALVRGLVDLPKVDTALRAELEQECHEVGAPALHARLSRVDPVGAAAIHPNDALRIVRALEVHRQTGRALGDLRREHALGENRRPTHFLVLDPPLDVLTPRIAGRVEKMVAAGWVDEVRGLLARYGRDVRALGSVGYREWVEHLLDGVPYDETLRRIAHSTRTYARRQRNWFHAERYVDTTVADAADVDATLVSRLRAHLEGRAPTETRIGAT